MTAKPGLRQLGARPGGPARSPSLPSGVRAEPNTATARPTLGQRLEAFHELGQDPQRPPRVRLEERGALRASAGEELLVLGAALAAEAGLAARAASTRGRGAWCAADGTVVSGS